VAADGMQSRFALVFISMSPFRAPSRLWPAIAAVLLALVGLTYWSWHNYSRDGLGVGKANADAPSKLPINPDSIDLSDSQLSAVKFEPVDVRDFPTEKQAVGSINFNQDLEVQVFTPSILLKFPVIGRYQRLFVRRFAGLYRPD
jgi:hypothetical protein